MKPIGTRQGPLAGLRVVELAHVMAGPVGGLMLADMGADVIKVEKLPGGDDTRRTTPPSIEGESASFMILNRNKRGIAVDLKSADGKALVRRMIARADVVLENYRPGTMEKMGLAYPDLQRTNPGLVYCKITGFGLTGPYAQRAGYDLISQGMSGLMGLTGEGPGRPPASLRPPASWPPTSNGCEPARANTWTPPCWRLPWSTPTGRSHSPSQRASRPVPWDRPIPWRPRTRPSPPPMAG
jgi:crotonobetainyl-CoA:carnitine CoA-transferase CaiB-like acyl-CoA transferase